MDTDSPRLRMSILGIVIVSLFGALFARLWYLQVMTAEEFQEVAVANTERVIFEEAPRGRILDREGRVLVDNRTSLVIAVSPAELEESDRREEVLLRIARELTANGRPTKVKALERRLDDPQYNPLLPVPVAIDVPEEVQVVVAERPEEFPGVTVRRDAVRAYPHGSLAAHVLGYVGRINETEFESRQGTRAEPIEHPKAYQPDSDIGKSGVEQVMEDELRGTPGVRRVEVDAKGNVVRTVEYTEPRAGNDVVLALDLELQRNTELALAEQLETARGRFTGSSGYAQGRAGSAVAMDPRSGAVLAMASYPTYDPSEFVNGISQQRWDELRSGDAMDNPLVNRAIAGLYEPGSTFKLVTAYGALKTGMITGDEIWGDGGEYTLPGCTGACTFSNAGGHAYGAIDLPDSLQVSSNTFYYRLGFQFSAEADVYGDGLQSAAREFGYGAPTGIDLPGEASGVVPDAAWKQRLWESLPPDQQALGDPTWYPGDSVNLAIGQGEMLATPLQITNSYAAFAGRGAVRQPFVVWKVLEPGTPLVREPATATAEDVDDDDWGEGSDGTDSGGAGTTTTSEAGGIAGTTTTSTSTSTIPGSTAETDGDLGQDAEADTEADPDWLALAPRVDLSDAVVVREAEPRVNYTFDLPQPVFAPIHDGLLNVTRVGYVHKGTAYDAFEGFDTDAFPLLSKTGTSTKRGRTDTAVFVACGPDPRSTICVGAVLEESGFGGVVAAPMVRRILEPVAGQESEDGQSPKLAESRD